MPKKKALVAVLQDDTDTAVVYIGYTKAQVYEDLAHDAPGDSLKESREMVRDAYSVNEAPLVMKKKLKRLS